MKIFSIEHLNIIAGEIDVILEKMDRIKKDGNEYLDLVKELEGKHKGYKFINDFIEN
ncbi:MAG: hypothetical protein ACRCZ0_08685 [Cetobacterium sp.]